MLRNICKESRVRLGLTQEEFATLLGVTRQTIIRWERSPSKVPYSAQVSILIADTEQAI